MVLFIMMILIHVCLVLFLQLITEIDIVVNPVMVNGGRPIPAVALEAESQINAVCALCIQCNVAHFVAVGRKVLAVHEQLNR